MLKRVLQKVVGDPVERALAKYRERVAEINALEPEIEKLSDERLKAKTQEFKERFEKGETLDDLLPEAFAVVREASRRTVGLRHYDVQLIGGIVLHEGRIAEMKTGEGKTLVATLPLYLNALAGKGVHLVTPNDYLSKVGVQTMGAVYNFLGLSAAVIQNSAGDPDSGSFIYDTEYPSNDARLQNLRPAKRREAYATDITYGTNNEFGFDYLRDNMVNDKSQLAQRDLFYAIIDEVDNILIDEARTPLIISGPADEPSPLYKVFAQVVKLLKISTPDSVENEEPDGDYVVDIKDRIVYLTEAGVEKVQTALKIDHLYHPTHSDMIPYLDNSLRAMALYALDKEYVIEDGQIIIVDEFTGRLMHGRRFSEGLHQAIEAKEGVQIRRENMTMATITFQNFFRMYKKLSGMTGTALTESEEFEKIYNLEVVAIPTNRPLVRDDYDDLIYMNEDAKFRAVTEEIKLRQQAGQPVLVGTVAIETSERLSKQLQRAGVKHQVLNAKQHEKEAEIIAQAGRPGAVTIATNMAGRGVDILLGGNPDGLARQTLRNRGLDIMQVSHEEWDAELVKARTQTEIDRQKVLETGGLFVLGTERHEARRIDNQLRGRSGRQGDPGESRFFLSLEDDLMKRFGGDRVKTIMNWAKLEEDEPLEHNMVSKSIAQAQVRVEGHHFDVRKRVLEYDDVVNRQRELIYAQRRQLLDNEGMRDEFLGVIEEQILNVLADFEAEGDPELLYRSLLTIFPVPEELTAEALEGKTREELEDELMDAAEFAYDKKTAELGEDIMKRVERVVMINTVDQFWRRHLTDLDMLREGIGLMSIAQRDPLVEYKREGFKMWDEMQAEIRSQAARTIFKVQVNQQPQAAAQQRRTITPQMMKQVMAVAQQQQALRNAQAQGGASTAEAQPPTTGGPQGQAASAPAPRLQAAAAPVLPHPAAGLTTNIGAKAEPVRKSGHEDIGRNDPCYCGSGKKYKNCHMRQDKKSE